MLARVQNTMARVQNTRHYGESAKHKTPCCNGIKQSESIWLQITVWRWSVPVSPHQLSYGHIEIADDDLCSHWWQSINSSINDKVGMDDKNGVFLADQSFLAALPRRLQCPCLLQFNEHVVLVTKVTALYVIRSLVLRVTKKFLSQLVLNVTSNFR